MYCVKCGVELADSERSCPLCGTAVYHPDIIREEGDLPYPPYKPTPRRLRRRVFLFVLAIVFVAVIIQLVICNIAITGRLTWAHYASGAIALAYLVVFLPMWFLKPNPVIFVPTGFAAIALFLFQCNYLSNGAWFWRFALPLLLGMAIIASALAALLRYVKRGYFFIFGGAVIALGLYVLAVEFLLYVNFLPSFYFWSVYPLISCFLCGMGLIVIGIVPAFREAFQKRFFI
jgi:hypothetical protein